MPAAAVAVPIPEVPVSQASPEALGELFAQYDPGAPTDMFAPGYIRGFRPSERAVDAWRAENRGLTHADIEATRMPEAWTDTRVSGVYPGGVGPYGAARVPDNLRFTDQRGTADPEALRALAQGGRYDMGARRASIAQRLMDNTTNRNNWARNIQDDPWYLGDDAYSGQPDQYAFQYG